MIGEKKAAGEIPLVEAIQKHVQQVPRKSKAGALKNKTGVMLRIPNEILRRLQVASDQLGMSQNSLIVLIVNAALAGDGLVIRLGAIEDKQ